MVSLNGVKVSSSSFREMGRPYLIRAVVDLIFSKILVAFNMKKTNKNKKNKTKKRIFAKYLKTAAEI